MVEEDKKENFVLNVRSDIQDAFHVRYYMVVKTIVKDGNNQVKVYPFTTKRINKEVWYFIEDGFYNCHDYNIRFHRKEKNHT